MVIVGGMLRLLLLGSHRPRGRALLSILGIALGVALGYGVYLVNRAAVDELAAAVRGLAGEADLEVRGGRGGFPESLYPAIARLPGVASVSPGLELDAGLAGTERTIRLIGWPSNWSPRRSSTGVAACSSGVSRFWSGT